MKNKISTIIIFAFLIRFLLLIINNFWFNLPQGGADAIRFDIIAYQISLSNYDYSLVEIISDGTRLHLWLGSLVYSIFGRVPFLWGLIMVVLGTLTVRNIHKVVFLITNNYKYANRSGWLAAFFPNFALLSALILREAPIHFFLSVSLLYLCKFYKFRSVKFILLFFVFGFFASLFHSGIFALFFGFIFFQLMLNRRFNLFSKLILSIVCLFGLFYINQSGIGLSKFGGSFEAGLETLQEGTGELAENSGANYPTWLLLKGSVTDLLIMPIRLIAFFLAPLIPFMIRSGSHLIGLIDVLFYLVILGTIYKRRKILFRMEINKAIMSMLIAISIVFSLGVSNFGTNIRHRAKVLPLLLMVPIILKSDLRKIQTRKDNSISY